MPKGSHLEAKLNKLPKGLQEFRGSLWDMRHAEELVGRLLDLSENGLSEQVAKHKAAMKKMRAAELALEAAKHDAIMIADGLFRYVVQNWTVKEIQQATGYDNT